MTSVERRIINAAGHLSQLGGGVCSAEVRRAMSRVAGRYVDVDRLRRSSERRIAELTRNEDCCITNGAAAALVTAIFAVAGNIHREPTAERRVQVILHPRHRVDVIAGVALAGSAIQELDVPRDTPIQSLAERVRGAAMILTLADPDLRDAAPPVETWVSAARTAGVPILVDAAAELPPVENLWYFSRELGASLVAFSGGKDLGAPQASGFLVGKSEFIEKCRRLAFPNLSVLRPLKVSKEAIAGLVVAVDRYLTLDHAARRAHAEAILEEWRDAFLKIPELQTTIQVDPISGLRLWLDLSWPQQTLPAANALREALWNFRPAIAVARNPHAHGIRITSWCLEPGSSDSDRIKAAVMRLLSNARISTTTRSGRGRFPALVHPRMD